MHRIKPLEVTVRPSVRPAATAAMVAVSMGGGAQCLVKLKLEFVKVQPDLPDSIGKDRPPNIERIEPHLPPFSSMAGHWELERNKQR